jgi:hypothetical protein
MFLFALPFILFACYSGFLADRFQNAQSSSPPTLGCFTFISDIGLYILNWYHYRNRLSHRYAGRNYEPFYLRHNLSFILTITSLPQTASLTSLPTPQSYSVSPHIHSRCQRQYQNIPLNRVFAAASP